MSKKNRGKNLFAKYLPRISIIYSIFRLFLYGCLRGGQQMLIISTYKVIVNYWRHFYDTLCTFLHAHGNENVFLRQNNLILCHIYVFC